MSTRRTNQELSAETRQGLVRAAIDCIHKHGYVGATTARIAERAGVTRGALQYHYKDPTDLMVAVTEAMYTGQIELFSAVLSPADEFEKRFAALIDTSTRLYDTREHTAFLELWMATRTDAALQKKLGPLIRRVESAIDAGFATAFPDAAVPAERLIDLRYLLQAALRGLALTRILHRDREFLERKVKLLRELVLAAATANR